MTCGAFSKKYNVFVKGIGIAALLFKEKLLYKFELFFLLRAVFDCVLQCCISAQTTGMTIFVIFEPITFYF